MLEKANATAQSLQVADKEAHAMVSQLLSSPVQAVNSSHKRTNKLSKQQQSRQSSPPGPCPACGPKKYRRSQCTHKNVSCFVCHHTGHLARVCRDRDRNSNNDSKGSNARNKQSQSNPAQQKTIHKTHLTETKEEEPDESLQILATQMTPYQQEGAVTKKLIHHQNWSP